MAKNNAPIDLPQMSISLMPEKYIYLNSFNILSEILFVPARSHQGVLDTVVATGLWGRSGQRHKGNRPLCFSQKPKFGSCLLGGLGLCEPRRCPRHSRLGSEQKRHRPAFLGSSEETAQSASQRLSLVSLGFKTLREPKQGVPAGPS